MCAAGFFAVCVELRLSAVTGEVRGSSLRVSASRAEQYAWTRCGVGCATSSPDWSNRQDWMIRSGDHRAAPRIPHAQTPCKNYSAALWVCQLPERVRRMNRRAIFRGRAGICGLDGETEKIEHPKMLDFGVEAADPLLRL